MIRETLRRARAPRVFANMLALVLLLAAIFAFVYLAMAGIVEEEILREVSRGPR